MYEDSTQSDQLIVEKMFKKLRLAFATFKQYFSRDANMKYQQDIMIIAALVGAQND